jgi:hypothetical protein
MNHRSILLSIAILGAGLPAFATVTYVCDTASFSDPANAAPANLCNMLNGAQVSNVYGGIFSNMNARIYIQFGPTGVGQSETNITAVPYSTYYNALNALSDDRQAVGTLTSGTSPLVPFGNTDDAIGLTAAVASALGITTNNADTAGMVADAASPTGFDNCVLGPGNPTCYNGYITVAAGGSAFYYPTTVGDNQPFYDFFSIVEHETDEILGTLSCIGTLNAAPFDQCNPGTTDAAPADLFRYASANTRTFLTTANGTPAYFSINSGVTDIKDYSNTPNGADYGDWTGSGEVQDGEANPGYNDITIDGGSEIAVLNAVGFNLTSSAVPEPATLGLLGASLVALAFLRQRHTARK